MKFRPQIASFFLLALASLTSFAADLPPTLMTERGKLLVEQNFEKPLPPFDGISDGFASGFEGWRYNSAARGGHWDVVNGTFRGAENPAAKHPATASYGFDFKNVVIQCEVQMHDVPMNGRVARHFQIRTTDRKDYVCSVILKEGGFRIEKSDNDHGGPDKPVPFGEIATPLKLDEWHQIVFEILGEEMVGTVDGKSLTGRDPLIATEKHSVMFVSGVEGSVRNFKVWEALPNPNWAKNKAKLESASPAKAH